MGFSTYKFTMLPVKGWIITRPSNIGRGRGVWLTKLLWDLANVNFVTIIQDYIKPNDFVIQPKL